MLIFSLLRSKYQTKGNLRVEGFLLVRSLDIQSAMMGKAWQPELFEAETTGGEGLLLIFSRINRQRQNGK